MWAVVLFGLSVRGLPRGTVWNTGYAVVTPLWVLGVHVLLLAATR